MAIEANLYSTTPAFKQTNTNYAQTSFICHIHNYTEYNEEWNVFSAFNPSKWSSCFSLQLLPLVYNPYLYSKALTCTLQPLPVF